MSSPIDSSQIDANVAYRPLLLSYIEKALCYSLAQVQAEKYTIADATRIQAWYVLTLAADMDNLWAIKRALLVELSPKMTLTGYWMEWIRYLQDGIELSCKKDDIVTYATLSLHLGHIYRRQGKWADARNLLERLLQETPDTLAAEQIALVQNELAFVYCEQRDYKKAETLVRSALARLNTEHPERANSYFILGIASGAKGDPDLAKQFLTKALGIRRFQGNQPRQANILVKLAMTELAQEQYDVAMEHIGEAIDLYTAIGDRIGVAHASLDMGIIFSLSGNSAKAVESYLAAEPIFRETNSALDLANTYLDLGIDYRILKKWTRAEEAFEASISIFRQMRQARHTVNAMVEFAALYRDQMAIANAKQLLTEAVQLVETIPSDPDYDRFRALIVQQLEAVEPENLKAMTHRGAY